MSSATSLTGQVNAVADLTSARRDEMFSLAAAYYAGMERDQFERDLNEKDWVIEVLDSASGELRGFSTQMVFELPDAYRPCRILFSGDTIVHEEYRLRNPLAGLWGRLVLDLLKREPESDWYWFLISKGYKTYRFLPVFFREFFPRFDRPTPPRIRRLIDRFGQWKYPAQFDRTAGLIRAKPDGCRLRKEVDDLTSARLRDPHVRYFVDRNPGYFRGDELCCLAPLKGENFTPAAERVIAAIPEFAGAQ